MADTISIAGFVIDITSRIIDYVGKVKDGFEERTRLVGEISTATGIVAILKELSNTTNKSNNSWHDALKTLAKLDGPLVHYLDVLKVIESQLEPKKGFKKTGATLTWPFRREKVLGALHEVERYKGLFTIALQVDNL